MNIAALLRYMQFYGHIGHNLLGGQTFFQDHSFLAELYAAYEDHYDDIIERMIGLEEELDLVEIQKEAVSGLKSPKSYEACYKELLSCEEELCKMVEKLVKDSSQGTANLLQDLADKSEMRQYKLKQRLK